MRILQKAKEVLTGKTLLERKQEKAALKVIRKDVNAARYKTQKEEAIKYAIEAEKHKYQQRLKRLKQPKQYTSNMGFGGMFDKSRTISPPHIITKKKGSKKNIHQPRINVTPQKRWNVINGCWE